MKGGIEENNRGGTSGKAERRKCRGGRKEQQTLKGKERTEWT